MSQNEIISGCIHLMGKQSQAEFGRYLKSKYPNDFSTANTARCAVQKFLQNRKVNKTKLIPVTAEEESIVYEFRNQHEALEKECEEKGIPKDEVKHYWFKSDRFSMFVKNNDNSLEEFQEKVLEYISERKFKFEPIKYKRNEESYLLVINPADIHIGKLATLYETKTEHNNKLIIQMVLEGVQGILNKCKGFNVDKILFIIGNDILHVDNAKRTTTSGTPQDTDGMWYDNYLLAIQLYTDVITMLLPIAPIHVQYDPSNHDYTTGFYLAQTIKAMFNNCKDITFNVDISHRKYFGYGKNLIGTTHGDGGKETDLPLAMAQEASEFWHTCPHRYIYTAHIHHKKAKDYGSVCIESFRSPSGTDSWHHRNLYQHAPRAIEAFLHHKEQGQIARITHIF